MVSLKFVLFSVYFLLRIGFGSTIVAYDCGSIESTVAELSLVDSKPCSKQSKNITSQVKYIQLVQPQSYKEVEYIQCLVEITHAIFRCGKTIDTPDTHFLYDEIFTLGKQDCITLLKERFFKYSGIKIEIGREQHVFATAETIGSIRGGSCTAGPETIINGILYDRPIRTSKFRISVSKGYGTLDTEEGFLITTDGLRCKFSEGTCFSANFGNVYWDNIFDQTICDGKSIIPIYEGHATEVTEIHKNITTKSFILHYEDYDFQIILTGKKALLCGQEALISEHPKLSVIIRPDSLPFVLKYDKKQLTKNVNLMTYMNSKLVYTMKHVKDQLEELYSALMYSRCLTETKLIQTILSSATTSPNEFAFQYFNMEGYTASVRGEVIYIMKCSAVSVNFTSTDYCYQEVPVTYNNKVMYMSPRSRMLTEIGNRVDCSSILPIKFKIQGTWFVVNNYGLIASPNPATMDISPDPNWEFKEIKNLAQSGIYSQSELDRLNRIMLAPVRETAIGNNLGRAVVGDDRPSGQIQFQNLMTPEDLLKFGKSKWAVMWDSFLDKLGYFGQICATLIGLIVIIKTVVFVINSIISIKLLMNVFGYSWRLIFFWWEHMVHIFLHNHHASNRNQNDVPDIENQLVEEEQTTSFNTNLFVDRVN